MAIGDPREIDTLSEALSLNNSTLFVVNQGGMPYKLSFRTMIEYMKDIFLSGGVPYGNELTMSWFELQSQIKGGNFTGIHIGDYKNIILEDGEEAVMEVAGIDQYYKCGDTTIGHHIDFISRDCLKDTMPFNTPEGRGETNNGTEEEQNPWKSSDLFKLMNDEENGVFSKLPDDLKPYIIEKHAQLKQRYSSSGPVNNSTGQKWDYMGKLWFPTDIEIFGNAFWSCDNTGYSGNGGCNLQYPLFYGGAKHIIKMKGNNNSSKAVWWIGMAVKDNNSQVCCVNENGAAGQNSPTITSVSVPLCFRIG